MATLVGFLRAAADEYRAALPGQGDEHADLFPPDVMEWAYLHDEALASLSLDLEESEVEASVRRPTEPFLQPIGRGDPGLPGWITEPVGKWNGRECAVVFDPNLHDVMVVPNPVSEDREGALTAAGWAYQGTDGHMVMWVRDRLAVARAALDRQSGPVSPEVESSGPELGGPEL